MSRRFYYCKLQIELGMKCLRQCDHCAKYYKPLEKERQRTPRKLKKRGTNKRT